MKSRNWNGTRVPTIKISIKRVLVLAIIVLAVMGCSKKEEDLSSSEAKWEVYKFGNIHAIPAKDGFYYLSKYNYLSYFDTKSETATVLCDRNGCEHDTKKCFAYIETGETMMHRDGRLFFLSLGAELDIANGDNTNRESYMKIGERYEEDDKASVASQYAMISGDMLYVTIWVTDFRPEAEHRETLKFLAINLLTKEEKEICSVLAENKTVELHAAKGDILYYTINDNPYDNRDISVLSGEERIAYFKEMEKLAHTELYRADVAAGTNEMIKEIKNGFLVAANDEIGIYYSEFIGDGFYRCKKWIHEDLNTQEQQVVLEAEDETGFGQGGAISFEQASALFGSEWKIYQLKDFKEDTIQNRVLLEAGTINPVPGGYAYYQATSTGEGNRWCYVTEEEAKKLDGEVIYIGE